MSCRRSPLHELFWLIEQLNWVGHVTKRLLTLIYLFIYYEIFYSAPLGWLQALPIPSQLYKNDSL